LAFAERFCSIENKAALIKIATLKWEFDPRRPSIK